MTRKRRTRFAPSPTGLLHLGHVVSALHARKMAGTGGEFLIRIEDIDGTRCIQPHIDALHADLGWLGFQSSECIRQQSQHFSEYQKVLENLKERNLLYPCFCTRSDIERDSVLDAPDGSTVYSGRCRCAGPEGRDITPVWRLNMARALDVLQEVPDWHEVGQGRIAGRAHEFGDIVLGRRDNGVSYHLCVTHDDALQGITCVTRGRDLYDATSVHRVLQELMGWPEPHYAHHPLIMDENGKKLSKRENAEGISHLRANGWSADEVLRHPLVLKAFGE